MLTRLIKLCFPLSGQPELCTEFWDQENMTAEPLRHFLHESRNLFPAVNFWNNRHVLTVTHQEQVKWFMPVISPHHWCSAMHSYAKGRHEISSIWEKATCAVLCYV